MNVFTTVNSIFPYLKGVALVLTLIFSGASLYYGIKTGWLGNRAQNITDAFSGSFRFRRRTLKAWKEITSHLQSGTARDWKLAIIEADILLNETLDVLGITGKTTGEKLHNMNRAAISNFSELLEARRVRNQIAHESGVDLDKETTQRTLAVYEKALQDLGLLN